MRRNLFVLAVLLSFAVFALFAYAGEGKKTATVTGTLVDYVCYAKAGLTTNDHGDMKNCGTMCAQGGLPVGVVSKDKAVVLAAPAPGYAKYVGKEVRISGMWGKHDKNVFLPQKLEVKENGKWVEKKLPKTMM